MNYIRESVGNRICCIIQAYIKDRLKKLVKQKEQQDLSYYICKGKIMSKILFISDTHFGHKNILRLNNRPYNDIEEMNRDFIEKWNNKVGKDDTVIHGGDVLFDTSAGRKVLNELHGHIVLIKGNHDGRLLKDAQCRKHFDAIYDTYAVETDGKKIVVNHMPEIEWNGMYRGALLCYGHIHNNIENDTYWIMQDYRKDNAFNIGVDILGGEPCEIRDVIERNKIYNEKNSLENRQATVEDIGRTVLTRYGLGKLVYVDAGAGYHVEPLNPRTEWQASIFDRVRLLKE